MFYEATERLDRLKPEIVKKSRCTDALLGSLTPNVRREVPNRSLTPPGAAEEPAGSDSCHLRESAILPLGAGFDWENFILRDGRHSFSPQSSFSFYSMEKCDLISKF